MLINMKRLLLSLFALIVFINCSNDPSKKIRGKWKGVGSGKQTVFFQMAFLSDGTFNIKKTNEEFNGKYHFLDDGRLKMEISDFWVNLLSAQPLIYQISFKGDTMIFKDEENKILKYQKIK